MPTIETNYISPIQPGYLDTLNGELTAAQESYLNSPKSKKKLLKTNVTKIENEIERVHALHAERPPLSGTVAYLWPSTGTLGLRLEVDLRAWPRFCHTLTRRTRTRNQRT